MEGMEDNNGPLLWFEGWNSTVQPKLEHLLATSLSRQQQDQSEGNNQRRWSKDHGLEIVMAGDSTIIQQFQVLSEFVYLRSDFYRVTGDNAEIRQVRERWSSINTVLFFLVYVFNLLFISLSSLFCLHAKMIHIACCIFSEMLLYFVIPGVTGRDCPPPQNPKYPVRCTT